MIARMTAEDRYYVKPLFSRGGVLRGYYLLDRVKNLRLPHGRFLIADYGGDPGAARHRADALRDALNSDAIASVRRSITIG
jgi:hypothetical protein